jgi:hypothetical protein
MAPIDAKNGKNFITVIVAPLGGLGAPIGPRMNMLMISDRSQTIGNRRDPLRSLMTFWGTFERAERSDGIRKSTVARFWVRFVRLRINAIVAG